MDLHDAVGGIPNEELESFEDQIGTQPHVLADAWIHRGAKLIGELLTHGAVDSVACDDEVVLGHELLNRGRLGPEMNRYSVACRTTLQHVQEFLATHRRESISRHRETDTVDIHVDVIPVREGAAHVLEDRRVRCLDSAEGLVAEHDAETERVVGSVALPHGDVRTGVELFDEAREIQAAGSPTDHRDPHPGSLTVSRICDYRQ